MKLENLTPAKGATKKCKRIGRGEGSGKGGTATRGTKGAQARAGYEHKIGFEGGQMPLVRRLPKRGFNNARFRVGTLGVNVADLEKRFEAGAEITVESLAKAGFSDNKRPRVKILASGELTKKLTVKVPCSASAKAKIESAGGSVA